MGNTFPTEIAALEPRDVVGFEVHRGVASRVRELGLARGLERFRALPAVRDQSKDGIQMAGTRRGGRLASFESLAAAARESEADGRGCGGQDRLASRRASGVGRTQIAPAVAGFGRAGFAGGLDDHADSAAQRLPRRRRGGQAYGFHSVRGSASQRALADGLQGARSDASRRALPSADGAGRPFALRLVHRRLRERADADGPGSFDRDVPALWPARTHDDGQWLALGRRSLRRRLDAADGLVDAPGRALRTFPAVPSADPRQGRADAPVAVRRGDAGDSRRPDELAARLRCVAPRLQHAETASGARLRRAGAALSTEPAALDRTPA